MGEYLFQLAREQPGLIHEVGSRLEDLGEDVEDVLACVSPVVAVGTVARGDGADADCVDVACGAGDGEGFGWGGGGGAGAGEDD